MEYKRKSDEIRICIILIKNRSSSKALITRKLNEMADLSEMYFHENLKYKFVKESLRLQELNKQSEWLKYYKKILLEFEMYELLSLLKGVFE